MDILVRSRRGWGPRRTIPAPSPATWCNEAFGGAPLPTIRGLCTPHTGIPYWIVVVFQYVEPQATRLVFVGTFGVAHGGLHECVAVTGLYLNSNKQGEHSASLSEAIGDKDLSCPSWPGRPDSPAEPYIRADKVAQGGRRRRSKVRGDGNGTGDGCRR